VLAPSRCATEGEEVLSRGGPRQRPSTSVLGGAERVCPGHQLMSRRLINLLTSRVIDEVEGYAGGWQEE
jgi:hypothetical protein